MLMVKADAYGFGIEEVATCVEDDVDAFGVVSIDEGIALRCAGIKKDILLCACACDEIQRAIDNNLMIALHNFEQVDALENVIKEGKTHLKNVRVHIKIDSVMHRLGFAPSEIKEVVEKLQKIRLECGKTAQNEKAYCLDVVGVYTHLRDETFDKKAQFDKCVQAVKRSFPKAICHVASSHSFGDENLRYDGIRLGISAYKGCMRVTSRVIESRRVSKDERIAYGDFILDNDANTAVVFGGYADGIERGNPSSVYIRSKKCQVIGNVCMDTFVVDTGDFLAEVGEEVVLLDEDVAQDVAKERKTIEYTLFTCWKGRIDRVYNGQKKRKTDCKRKPLEDDR